ncbi:MAG: hypothetical protein ACKO7Q_11765, partial [Actinomycetota bacterium]
MRRTSPAEDRLAVEVRDDARGHRRQALEADLRDGAPGGEQAVPEGADVIAEGRDDPEPRDRHPPVHTRSVPDRRAACDRAVSGSSQAHPQGCIRTTRRPPRSIPMQFTKKTILIGTAALVGVAAIGGTAV